MAVTIREVSQRCGLSISSVSKALNNYPNVREETRLRVLKVANEIGYCPNILARGLKTNKTRNIGVLLTTDVHNAMLHTFFALMLNGFRSEADKFGYDVTLINQRVHEKRRSLLNHIRSRNFDAVCFMCVDFADTQINDVILSEVPCITIDHAFDGSDCILADNKGGMRKLVDYAVRMGHTKIAYVYGTPSFVTSVRYDTFVTCMSEHRLAVPREYLIESYYHDPKASAAATRVLLSLPNPPTCVLYPDDLCALGAIEAVRTCGLSVPNDLSIIGYDGTDVLQKISPRLTTMRQHADEIGRRAIQRLLEKVDSPNNPPHHADIIPSALIEGETTARIAPQA
ncbi:MAG: LacI family transcriptional regulator [Oscillospiraceae bacterium]|nr:LacI family transcriptional regulator [Oscillospiraceae bacterium]